MGCQMGVNPILRCIFNQAAFFFPSGDSNCHWSDSFSLVPPRYIPMAGHNDPINGRIPDLFILFPTWVLLTAST